MIICILMKKQFWSIDSVLIRKIPSSFLIFSSWFIPFMRNLTKKSSFHNKSFSRLTGYSQKRLRETQIWLLKYQKLEYFYGELQGNDTVRQRLRKKRRPLHWQSSGCSTQGWPQWIQLQVVNADSYNNSWNTVTPEKQVLLEEKTKWEDLLAGCRKSL